MSLGASLSRLSLFLGTALVLGPFAAGESRLIFPRISNDDQTLTGIAFVNTSDENAMLRITLHDDLGQVVSDTGVVNPVELEIGPGRQLARTIAELFSRPLDPGLVGWMEAVSETSGITGFYLYLNADITFFDGADGPEAGRKIVFSLAREDDRFSSEFNLINPLDLPIQFDVRLYRPGSVAVTREGLRLPAKGVFRFSLPELFQISETPSGSYVSVLASGPVSGFQFVRQAGGDLIGLNAPLQDQGLGELYFPQMAVLEPWLTELGLVNHGDQAALVSVYAYKRDGTLFGDPDIGGTNPAVFALEPEQGTVRDVAELFGFAGGVTLDGWLKVQSTSARTAGFVGYGIPATGSWASVAAQVQPLTQGIFSHIATTLGYFTGVAVLNPNALSTGVRITAYSGDGEVVGSFSQVLEPGQRDSRLITELVPGSEGRGAGYIFVSSEHPIFMTSLFGTSRILANIPPQPVQGLEPSASFTIVPPLAVVQPGRPYQFRVEGDAIPVTWAVQGEGAPGSIDNSGKYTAPAQAPQVLPVTISAAGAGSIVAASVDVLEKEQLLAEVGVVQAVAYLGALERLYSAELTGISGQALASGRVQQESPSSRVVSVAPGGRIELAQFPGEIISKMIPYEASQGGHYLLLLSKSQGRVIRFDPVTKSQLTVVQGLQSPDSMVFDESSGNLLVADQSQIRAYTRALIERSSGAQGAGYPAGPTLPAQQEDTTGLAGIAVDQCTGRLVLADQRQSAVVAFDRETGEQTVLAGDLSDPGELLALYRAGMDCPEAFHLLVNDPGQEKVFLLGPGLELDLEWPADRAAEDLAFLPNGNPVTQNAAVVFAELPTTTTAGAVSTLAAVETGALYSDRPGNPPSRPSGSRYGDPALDTLNRDANLDILALEAHLGEGQVVVFLLMSGTTTPGVELGGFLDLDTDQDSASGTTSHIDQLSAVATGLGVEVTIDLETYDPQSQTVALSRWSGSVYEEAGRVPLLLNFDPLSLDHTTLIEISIPLSLIGGDALFDFAAAVGDLDQITDIAPNRGFLRVGTGP